MYLFQVIIKYPTFNASVEIYGLSLTSWWGDPLTFNDKSDEQPVINLYTIKNHRHGKSWQKLQSPKTGLRPWHFIHLVHGYQRQASVESQLCLATQQINLIKTFIPWFYSWYPRLLPFDYQWCRGISACHCGTPHNLRTIMLHFSYS